MAFTVDIVILLVDDEQVTHEWWHERYRKAVIRAGGMPPEVAAPTRATLWDETDPEHGDRYARVTLPLKARTTLPRARELSHLLTRVLDAEGYTLRQKGKPVELIPGDQNETPSGSIGDMAYSEARVCSGRCLGCIFSSETRIACCTQGCAFSLADIGAALIDGEDQFVQSCLQQPGEMDGMKWQPYLSNGKCIYHSPDRGCTLPPRRMPLQCRTYLCAPERLLPPELAADYQPYVDALEEAEMFIEEHMQFQSGVDMSSPLNELRAAARRAFAAWEAGR